MAWIKSGSLFYQQEAENVYRVYTETCACVAVVAVPKIRPNYDLDKKLMDNICRALSI